MATKRTGLVLSGGGARGAYEVGVLRGVAEVVGGAQSAGPLFDVVAGTSVGAINGAWVVANAHRPAHDVQGLCALWQALDLREFLRVDLLGLVGVRRPLGFWRRAGRAPSDTFGQSVLDVSALERLVGEHVDFPQLHHNVRSGLVHAFVVAALHIGTGLTTLFTELAPGAQFKPTKNPRQRALAEPVEKEHVLASAAIPALFPARRVGRSYFVDGGLRFNTPVAPAIRAGAERLVVVSLRHEAPTPKTPAGPADVSEQYPNVTFLLGKVFNALLLDPVAYDLQVLERFNALSQVLDETLSADERAKVDAVIEAARGSPYRRIPTLAFEPSQNIGVLAGEHLREHASRWRLGHFYEWLLAKAGTGQAGWEADLASYLLFDGVFAERLIALGRQDVLARRDEVRSFFEG